MSKTKTASWVRNKSGNRALGMLYSNVKDDLLRANVSISEAKLLYPDYHIYEETGGRRVHVHHHASIESPE